MTNNGLNRVRDLWEGDMYHGEIGSGTTLETEEDTILVTAISSSEKVLVATNTDKQISEDYDITSAEFITETISEFGIKNTSDTLFSRVTFDGYTHVSTENLTIRSRFFVKSL